VEVLSSIFQVLMHEHSHFPARRDRLRRVGNPIRNVMNHRFLEIQFHRDASRIQSPISRTYPTEQSLHDAALNERWLEPFGEVG
jgi:hypothetical protein